MKPITSAAGIGTVICSELKDIALRRGQQNPAACGPAEWQNSCHNQKLFGISISGGGIRSATFALGVLQGLHEKGLVSKADYLSTVSGGGYIGAWLQGILNRGPKSYEPLTQHIPQSSETDPITFLRKYSNYLAPRVGLSLDAIVIPVIWLRNMLLNQAIIISAIASLFLLLSLPGVGIRALANEGNTLFSWIGLAISCLLGLIAIFWIGRNLHANSRRELEGGAPAGDVGRGTQKIGIRVALPLVLAVVFLLFSIASDGSALQSARGQQIGFSLLWFLLAALQTGGGFVACYEAQHKKTSRVGRQLFPRLHVFWMSLTTAFFIYFLLYEVSQLVTRSSLISGKGSQDAIAWMPPLYLVVLMLGITLQIGLMGKDFPDASREWLARTGALLVTVTATWAFFFAIGVFSPYWVAWIWLIKRTAIISAAIAWAGSTLATVLAGKSPKTGDGTDKTIKSKLDLVARYGPFIAIPGFLIAVAFGTQALSRVVFAGGRSGPFLSEFFDCYWQLFPYEGSSWKSPLVLLFGFTAVFVVLSLRVNINEFSLHHFYKNRLVRCYLGASVAKTRVPDPFTGFDPRDDIPLQGLVRDEATPDTKGPYPIINATLNVTAGSELATQERKALPWIFTPHYSGYVTGRSKADQEVMDLADIDKTFIPSSDILGGGVHLGTATAISGAAVSPNMGFHSAPQTAFLLTLFDVRLGWWIGNPRNGRTCWRPGPLFALWWLTRELLGFVDVRSEFLNLSDGGHFENLGLYELVRRRCRYVVAIDGEEDPDYHFDSLGGAVRKCRADFGVEIDIDPRPIRPDGGRSRLHAVVGRIYYPEPKSEPGWLLYLKTSITGNEPADVEEYLRENPKFPQQSTLDQFFSESQFESYRRLGLHEARTVLDHFDAGLPLEDSFARLSARWELPEPAPEGAPARHAEAYSRMMGRLEISKNLRVFDAEFIENLPRSLAKNDAERERFFFCLDLLQLIETVFLDLNFANEHSWNHPGNAGWKREFEYWARQPSIQDIWTSQKLNYGTVFQNFFDDLVTRRDAPPCEQRI